MNGIAHSYKVKNVADTEEPETSRPADGAQAAGASTTAAGAPAGASASDSAGASASASASDSAAKALGLRVAPVTFAWGLHAYLLTRGAATRLVDHLPVSAPADIFVGSFLAATDSGRPILSGRAVLPALATTPAGEGSGGAAAAGGATAGGDFGDVVSSGTRRAGVAHGVWS